jgi:ATP-dependent RNA helicase DDX23/PRP28
MNGHLVDIPAPPPSIDTAPRPPSPPADVPPPPPDTQDDDYSVVPKRIKNTKQKKPTAPPLNVEELLKRKREADLAASKPKFLSKAEREWIAREKQAKEEAEANGRQVERFENGGHDKNGRNGDRQQVPVQIEIDLPPDQQHRGIHR